MQGFEVLNIKHSESSTVTHAMYMRPHSVREKIPEKPPDRTLFIVGVPPYINEDILISLFKQFGTVKAVYLHKNPSAQLPLKNTSEFFPTQEPIKGHKIAYVVFQKEKGLHNALQNNKTLILPKGQNLCGMKKWVKEYNNEVPDIEMMENEIKEFMTKFDAETEEKNKKDKGATEADEDGWITVTKKGRRPGFARKESVKNQLMKKEEKSKKKKELTDFYRFQIRESKMKNLATLRQKFEEDKKKIAALKATRRFKPF